MKKAIFGLLCLSSLSLAATRADLDSAVSDVGKSVEANEVQSMRVVDVINTLIAAPLTVVVGNVAASQGQSVNLPVFFKSGTLDVSGVQFDLVLSSNAINGTVQPGPAAVSAGKNVQSSIVSGRLRVIVAGFNQTSIRSGVLVTVPLVLTDDLSIGQNPILITDLVGSSPSGTSVELSGKSGSLLVD